MIRRLASCLTVFVGVATAFAANSNKAAGLSEQFLASHPGSHFYMEGAHLDKIYGRSFSYGLSATDSAERFVDTYAGLWGVDRADLAPGNWFNDRVTQPVLYQPDTDTYRFTLAYYAQSRDGVPVFRADLRLLMRNDDGYPLVLANSALKDIGELRVSQSDLDSADASAAYAAAFERAPDLVNFSQPTFVIFAGHDDVQSEPHLALQFAADNGLAATPDYSKWLFVADAATGAILYQEDQIIGTDITGNVSGLSTNSIRADLCDDEVSMPLKYARVEAGSTVVYTDENGDYTLPNDGDSSVTVKSPMRGQWFVISDQTGKSDSLSQSVTPPGPDDFLHNASNDDEDIRAETNVYIHANVVRDNALAQNPQYPVVYNQKEFTANVNLASTCNAYYDGSSINFFHSGGGCSNTGNSTVVHHEYGHHLVASGGSGQGEYGEGMADCQGVIIEDDSRLGLGFYANSCDSPLRDANNSMTYPCSGEIHYCGMLISGCVWDTRNALKDVDPDNYLAIIRSLTVNSILLHDGSSITPQITIDFLTVDDNDDDISNGTPHYYEIDKGFSKHKMDAPDLAPIVIELPNGTPTVIDPRGNTKFRVLVKPLGSTAEPGSGLLHYSTDGTNYSTVAMVVVDDDEYDATFPELPCGNLIHYYVSAKAVNGDVVSYPKAAPAGDFQSFAIADSTPVFTDNFESDLGWTTEKSANLITGKWDRGIPVGGEDRGQPYADSDGSGQCWLTDNRDGNYDVDGDYVRLISPTIDLSNSDAIITYARWYYSSDLTKTLDKFTVAVSNDDGATWVKADVVNGWGPESKGGWYPRGFHVAQFVQPTDKVKVRFEAIDYGQPSRVECAVDAFQVLTFTCGDAPQVIGDMDCSGEVNFNDIDGFVTAIISEEQYSAQYPDCFYLNGDTNQDTFVDFNDIDPFVELLTK